MLHAIDHLGLVHLVQLVDQSIGERERAEVAGVWALLICYFFDVAGLHKRFVLAHGDAAMIDFLLEDSGGEVDIEGGIDDVLRGLLHFIRIVHRSCQETIFIIKYLLSKQSSQNIK